MEVPDNLPTLLSEFDDQIAQHLDLVRKLKVQRNAISPACLLPFDILSLCFLFYKDSLIVNRNSQWGASLDHTHTLPKLKPLAWATPSYVCRRWREVALDCATLWDTVYLDSVHWTEELLHRSKESELHVNLDNFTPQSQNPHFGQCSIEESFYLAMTQSHRIRELNITATLTAVDLNSLAACILSRTFPVLRTVRMSDMDAYKQLDAHADGAHLTGRPVIMHLTTSSKAPKLDYVDLVARNWQCWQGIKSDQLSSLSICHTSTRFPYPSLFSVHQVLQNLPNLQDLRLFGVLKHWNETPFVPEQPVQLPLLRTLSLWFMSLPDTALALALFDLDIAVEVRIICQEQPRATPVITEQTYKLMDALKPCIFPPFTAKGKERQPPQFRSVLLLASSFSAHIAFSYDEELLLVHEQSGYRHDWSHSDQRINPFNSIGSFRAEGADLDIDLGPNNCYDSNPVVNMLGYAGEALENVESLTVMCNGPWHYYRESDWNDMSKNMPNLKNLEVNVNWEAHRAFLNAFNSVSEEGEVIFPKLEKLVLRRLNFTNRSNVLSYPDGGAFGAVLYSPTIQSSQPLMDNDSVLEVLAGNEQVQTMGELGQITAVEDPVHALPTAVADTMEIDGAGDQKQDELDRLPPLPPSPSSLVINHLDLPEYVDQDKPLLSQALVSPPPTPSLPPTPTIDLNNETLPLLATKHGELTFRPGSPSSISPSSPRSPPLHSRPASIWSDLGAPLQGPVPVPLHPFTGPPKNRQPPPPTLPAVLTKREEHGSLLQLLCLYDCWSLTPGIVASLEDVVDKVQWDTQPAPAWDPWAFHQNRPI